MEVVKLVKNSPERSPGSLCKDNGRLCVLVKVGTSEDAPYTRLMEQAGILQPFGWFLDLEQPNIRFETLKYPVGENVSGCWMAELFSRNLDVVEWSR